MISGLATFAFYIASQLLFFGNEVSYKCPHQQNFFVDGDVRMQHSHWLILDKI